MVRTRGKARRTKEDTFQSLELNNVWRGTLFGKLDATIHQVAKLFHKEKDNMLYLEYGQFRMPLGNKCAALQLAELLRGSGPCEREQSTREVLEVQQECWEHRGHRPDNGNVGNIFVR